ncbi:flagellar basal body-associated FliL family protein [Carnobacterium mobile]|uniref:flagellar basal body-associated FliL family protein n=1 Tax=Carnobacterium mobile TaxID=2750 RepID=UPI0018663B59|nr:flagellar basal body-associated FliL family protein [Carnobacterium mobile]
MKTEDKKEKQGTKRMLIIVAILGAIVIGAVVSFGVTSGKAAEIIEGLSKKEVVETTVPLEEFLINLAPEKSGRGNYLKIELSVYSTEKDAEEEINKNIPQIRDAVINVLRTKSADSVFQKEEDSLVLKKELISQINKTLDEPLISDVFITNIVMQ